MGVLGEEFEDEERWVEQGAVKGLRSGLRKIRERLYKEYKDYRTSYKTDSEINNTMECNYMVHMGSIL